MDKIKHLFERKSLKSYFVQYMFFCVLGALIVSFSLSSICQIGQDEIYKRYQNEQSNYQYITDSVDGDEEHIIKYEYDDAIKHFSSMSLTIYNVLGFLSVGVYPISFIIAIFLASYLFYKRQLYTPLTILSEATAKIADNDLDFHISYNQENELGKLCVSFETMRTALKDNNLEMWRQVEERKRLNAAFAHDLRTPLTVLKGQSEMLAKYAPQMPEEKIISTAEMMGRHISRLEVYVNAMNDLQRLEDIEIKKDSVSVKDIKSQIQITNSTIGTSKEILFKCNISDTDAIKVDLSVIMQVYENLLANAIRFAENQIRIFVDKQDDYFVITIIDDGGGFSDKDLSYATKPFYKSESETDSSHFGMGLNISKILCEKHGGYLKLSNDNGAKVVAAFKK